MNDVDKPMTLAAEPYVLIPKRSQLEFGRVGLALIDLQPSFWRGLEGTKSIQGLLDRSVRAIRWARSRRLPIFNIRYAGYKKSHEKITEALKGYSGAFDVVKNDDGVCVSPILYSYLDDIKKETEFAELVSQTQRSTVIVMGVNSHACVAASIDGMQNNGIDVLLPSDGHAHICDGALSLPKNEEISKLYLSTGLLQTRPVLRLKHLNLTQWMGTIEAANISDEVLGIYRASLAEDFGIASPKVGLVA